MLEYRVEHEADVIAVQRAARERACELGFKRIDSIEIAIVASELASNIVKYGVRGSLRIEPVDDLAKGLGIRLTAFDCGPPFHDFSLALKDGFNDKGPLDPASLIGRRGIGAGLGAVMRFSDEFGWEPTNSGKRVWVVRYMKRNKRQLYSP